jgi:hypothetical protein
MRQRQMILMKPESLIPITGICKNDFLAQTANKYRFGQQYLLVFYYGMLGQIH